MPPSRRKWLNIVFDLNGILCHSALKSGADKFKHYKLEDNVLCHWNPTIIGPKAVFARQNVGEFLQQVSEIAHRIIVWTTMFKRNAEPIAGHLFGGCRAPYDVLGQEQCTRIEIARGKFFHWGPKVHLMKVLSEALFSNNGGGSPIDATNTLLIDDSLEKSVCNENGNAIFLETWSHTKQRDNVLMDDLLPWLQRLHSSCLDGGLQQYVEDNRIGLNPLDRHSYYLQRIMDAMKESAEVTGSRFELPGIGVVIEK